MAGTRRLSSFSSIAALLIYFLVVSEGRGHAKQQQRLLGKHQKQAKGNENYQWVGSDGELDEMHGEEESSEVDNAMSADAYSSHDDSGDDMSSDSHDDVDDDDSDDEMSEDCSSQDRSPKEVLLSKYLKKGNPNMKAPPKGKKHNPKGKSEGKGKGKEKSDKTAKSKKECSKSPKNSKSLKSSKKGKGGKGKKKSGEYPTPTPHGAPSNDEPSSRPPVEIPPSEGPPSPVQAPSRYTPSPTHQGSVAVQLSKYGLSYEVSGSSVPQREDLMALSDLTRRYLEEFMFAEFSRTSMTILDDFVTKYITANTFPMGGTAVVEFNSTARFAEGTEIFPSRAQLDEAVRIAFTGENLDEYIFRLRSLPNGNVFQSSPDVEFVDPPLMVSVRKERSSATGAVIIGAVGLSLLAAAFVLYKRLPQDEEMEDKDLYNKSKGGGTVAGDTYAGDTYDCTASIDASSLLDPFYPHRDEEDGRPRNNLGVIREVLDTSSVAPVWDGESDDDDDGNEQRHVSSHGRSLSNDSPSVDHDAGRLTGFERGSFESSRNSGIDPNQNDFEGKAPDIRRQNGFNRSHSNENHKDGNQEYQSDASEVSDKSRGTEGHFEGLNSDSQSTNKQKRASQHEIVSLLSYDVSEDQQIEEHQEHVLANEEVSLSSRPRTVSEIEILLSAEQEEDSCSPGGVGSRTGSAFDIDDISTPTTRPRTVSEIEDLLSQDAQPASGKIV